MGEGHSRESISRAGTRKRIIVDNMAELGDEPSGQSVEGVDLLTFSRKKYKGGSSGSFFGYNGVQR